MAFGDTGVRDNFNRSNEGPPLGTNWTASGRDVTGFKVVSQHGEASTVNNLAEEYYNVADYGPDVEAFLILLAVSSSTYLSVNARMADEDTSTPDSYYVQVQGTTALAIWRMDDGEDTQLGSGISQTIDADDAVGIQVIGDEIDAYFNNDGAGWSSVGQQTDSTYSAAGRIALSAYISGGIPSATQFDDFGGGTLAGGISIPVIMAQYRQRWR